MKKTKKETGVSVISIVFYVIAVVFLCIAAFNIWQAYQTVQSYQLQYSLTLSDILGVYFSNCAQYFAYAFVLYGVGVALNKIAVLNKTLCTCMDSGVEEAESSEVEDVAIDETLKASTIETVEQEA